jgi:peptidoglycan/LPS O-acetylase OafA/YrhL
MNIKNWMETIDILTTPGVPTLVPAAYFAVDTFFWIGGFLITIGLVDQMMKAKSFLKFYGFSVLHRFIRIWPTYMLAILVYWKVAPYIFNGPIWYTFSIVTNSCSNGGILYNMFFIDNFANHGPQGMDYCFGWVIYISNIGMVSCSRFPTIFNHTIYNLRLFKE